MSIPQQAGQGISISLLGQNFLLELACNQFMQAKLDSAVSSRPESRKLT
jgi:hypothetical protein